MIWAALQFTNDSRRIRHYRAAVAMDKATGQFKDGGAAFEKNAVVIADRSLGRARDLPFFFVFASAQRVVAAGGIVRCALKTSRI